MDPLTLTIDDAPDELAGPIREFWPEEEWDNAARVSRLESGWRWDAENRTADQEHPCGSYLEDRDGVRVTAEWSIGYFQVNACNLPAEWNPSHLFNARQNAGTAHAMWKDRGWEPWYFSAKKLGLLPG